MEKTSFQFEKDMIEDLDAVANVRGMNRSQVVRKFLGDKLEECKAKGEIK